MSSINCLRLGMGAARQGREGFFFVKKKQKTFIRLGSDLG
jgi:hypothetical protein